ncbi:nicotinamide riboside kinase 2-like [Paramacrobiotus metropolitanus]|uniref:nicotinamide riboside kinase 2-like n=1 Tax=Paramacrobiotus metropolitanus TaxID=2943436 RepID=UPI002445781A|nr:nicotinamide riboside kinase 2-like [Paramacrobiotus metropolitanus]
MHGELPNGGTSNGLPAKRLEHSRAHHEPGNDVIIVGIAGATNAGKTTVARRLLEEFPRSAVVHQDDFFRSVDDPAHEHVVEINHHNWDTISAVDFERMLQSVKENYTVLLEKNTRPVGADSRPRLLILEGILIFNVPQLACLLDRKYLITLTKEECRRRRLTRNYDPADVPGYFDLVVWPMYEKFLAQLQGTTDIEYFDGNDASERTVQVIVSDLLNLYRERLRNTPPSEESPVLKNYSVGKIPRNPSGDASVPVV